MSKLEIIEFYRPDENSKNIFVTRIPRTVDEDELYVRLTIYILAKFRLSWHKQSGTDDTYLASLSMGVSRPFLKTVTRYGR